MRTPTQNAEDLANYIDAFVTREYEEKPGDFFKNVLRPIEATSDSYLKEVQELDMTAGDPNYSAHCCLWAAHHIAKAKKLDAAGKTSCAYQEVIEAYKFVGNMTSFHLILKSVVSKGEPIRKAQEARHLTTKEIEAFAVSRFRDSSFPSPHKASIALAPEVRQFAAAKGQPMSEDRAPKTIYGWLLRSMKEADSYPSQSETGTSQT